MQDKWSILVLLVQCSLDISANGVLKPTQLVASEPNILGANNP